MSHSPQIDQITGQIHAFESFGTLDGPGIRLVLFLSKCPLLCQYCHNIDVVMSKHAQTYSVGAVLAKVLKDRPYFKASDGGITLSGGDPLAQPIFTKALLQACHNYQIHTCLDTSLYTSQTILADISPYTDLFMISLKHFNNKIHQQLTGVSNRRIFDNISFLSKQKKRIWFRYLVLPGYTDTEENLTALINFLKTVNFELVELLAYHNMGVHKWRQLGLFYQLPNIKPPELSSLKLIQSKLESHNIKVVIHE